MAHSMAKQGNWLFRWRSYLPAVVIPFVVIAIWEGDRIGAAFGENASQLWSFLAVCIAFLGLGMRALVVGFVPWGTSGRNTSRQIAHTLNQTGAYSIVRHPIYLANFVIFFGILMLAQSPWLSIASSLAYWMYYERIICAEDLFLREKFGETFERWAERTPAVLPNLRGWVRPELTFCIRTVLFREHSTMFLIVSAITLLIFVKRLVAGVPCTAHPTYLLFFLVGTILYLSLRNMKKHTDLLYVVGR